MGVSRDDIVTQMRDALLISDPEVDTSVGTPLRKILDAVGNSLADAYVENHLLSYAYDIDSKIDADLDAFLVEAEQIGAEWGTESGTGEP